MTLRISGVSFACFVASTLAVAACGDDSGGGGGTGGSGGADAAVSGGGGGTGGTADSGAPVDTAACIAAGDTASAMGFATRPPACKECICGNCAIADVSACDDNCWGLINCVATMCAGNGSDVACIVPACGTFLNATPSPVTAATNMGMCAFPDPPATSCRDVCQDMGAGADAGADTDGG